MDNDNKNNNGRDDLKLLFAEIEKCLRDISKETVLENKVHSLSYVMGLLFTLFKKKSHISYVTYLHLKKRIERLENRRRYNQVA